MVSVVLSRLVLISCVVLLPAVWADDCAEYWDEHGQHHDSLQCIFYCCGHCNNKYCCSSKTKRLTEENCSARSLYSKQTAVTVGSIIGSIFPVIFCVTILICCLAPCCFCYKKCRKRRNRASPTVITTIVTGPPQPLIPYPHVLPYPGYVPVPVQTGYSGKTMPTAPPPSYQEATELHHSSAAYMDGQSMYPLHPIRQPLPLSDEFSQPPYNPSYTSKL